VEVGIGDAVGNATTVIAAVGTPDGLGKVRVTNSNTTAVTNNIVPTPIAPKITQRSRNIGNMFRIFIHYPGMRKNASARII
jgi:hypothetical protein